VTAGKNHAPTGDRAPGAFADNGIDRPFCPHVSGLRFGCGGTCVTRKREIGHAITQS
jgi:hypothetical protein